MSQIHLEIITQEKHLLTTTAESLTVPTSEGEITVLPGHSPLFAKLDTGELIVRHEGREDSYVVSGGFIDIAPKGVTVLTDTAIRSDAINVAKAEEARRKAEEVMENQEDRQEYILAEAQLRRALMELKIAEKHKNRRNQGQRG